MPTDGPIFRFAPSPNGFLHLGHAYSALTTFDMAKRAGGQFLLRIEDIDPGRSRADFVDAIIEDLTWLGLTWPEPVLCQSQRFTAYRTAIDRLRSLNVLYPCAATRSEVLAAAQKQGCGRDPDGAWMYPGRDQVISADETHARIAAGQPHALRLDMHAACHVVGDTHDPTALDVRELNADGDVTVRSADPQRWGDAVIVRKDVPTSYHLAVVVDDAFQGVTHVTRGRDLSASTDLQRLLQILLGLPDPIYFHHPLILDDTGKKLSKSDGADAIRSLRDKGCDRDGIRALICAAKFDTPDASQA